MDTRILGRGFAGLAALFVTFAVGCGKDSTTGPGGDGGGSGDPATVPESWAGVWRMEFLAVDCETREIRQEAELDTLCAGEPMVFEFPLGEQMLLVPCDGTLGDTMFVLDCASMPNIVCPSNLSISLAGTKDPDSFTGTGSLTIAPTEACPLEFRPLCFDLTLTGTRISSEATGCPPDP